MKTKARIEKRRGYYERIVKQLGQEQQSCTEPKRRSAIVLELSWRLPELRAMDWVLSDD